MEANYSDPQFQENEEMRFLYQIRKELSLESIQDSVILVAAVLQSLRQTLTMEENNTLLNQLPDFLQLAYAANWQQHEPRVKVDHLDEFVSLVMDRDEQSGKGLFRTEVQALTVVILTLKKLNKLVDLENFDGISPLLKQELREVSSEAA